VTGQSQNSLDSVPPHRPPAAPRASLRAFLRGAVESVHSVFILVTIGTFLGIGALAHDMGFSLAWAVAGTILMWAGPAQVILISTLGSGAPLAEAALAVALSAVRLLPMVVSLIPILRTPHTRRRDLILPAHFIAVTLWVEGLRLLPGVAREDRIAFLNGFGSGFVAIATVATTAGYLLAASLPPTLTAALLLLTPLAFLLSLAGNVRALVDKLALGLGLVFSPVLAALHVELDLIWGGLAAGTIAYVVHRLRSRAA
jgi:predicted branched-subunit amino acid permease